MFHVTHPLVLASGSPRRQQFLHELGLTFSIDQSNGEEPRPEACEDPAAYAMRAAAHKAAAVAPAHPGCTVVAADTIVVIDGDILGKPNDADESLSMLERLSGREHTVITAVGMLVPDVSSNARSDARPVEFFCSSRVRFHPWPRDILAAYAHSGEPLDKAGAYAVQGLGAFLVAEIHGSWSNVVGLPLTELTETLLRLGVIRLA